MEARNKNQSGKIQIKSPTRVDLAGGTLDLWPLYNFVGGASTINIAIDIFTYAEIEPLGDSSVGGPIELISTDVGLSKVYKNLQECLADDDPRALLLRKQIEYWQPKSGFKLTTKSESPVGGGLGGSSSLTISLLKAFERFTGESFQDIHSLVNVAHNIEAGVLNTPTGTQDYYPAATGGVNILSYSEDGISLEVLDQNTQTIADHCLVVYTGKSHHSGINNFQVLTNAVKGDAQTMKALWELKQIAEETVTVVKESQWKKLPQLFNREFSARVKLAEAFSSPEIEKLSEVALRAGAEAVKICGAGGGGCVLVWAEPSQKEQVKKACQMSGFQVLAARPVKKI